MHNINVSLLAIIIYNNNNVNRFYYKLFTRVYNLLKFLIKIPIKNNRNFDISCSAMPFYRSKLMIHLRLI